MKGKHKASVVPRVKRTRMRIMIRMRTMMRKRMRKQLALKVTITTKLWRIVRALSRKPTVMKK